MSAKSESRSNKAAKVEEPKKRRRKKARTAEISDSDSSDSDSDGVKDEDEEEEENIEENADDGDVEMMEFEKGDVAGVSDTMDIPTELQSLPADSANPEFQKFYMNLVTNEFGKDMDDLRTGDTFNGNTLGLLVDALKQGVNVFDEKVQREVVEQK